MERALELTASSTIRPPQTKPQHQQQMARRIRSELLREGQPRKPQRKAQGSTLLNIKAEKLQQAAGLGTFTILAGQQPMKARQLRPRSRLALSDRHKHCADFANAVRLVGNRDAAIPDLLKMKHNSQSRDLRPKGTNFFPSSAKTHPRSLSNRHSTLSKSEAAD